MGFIPSSSTIQLYAYFTQYGREKIANSIRNDVRVTQFSLHDDDVNYILTKEIVNGTYNKLPTGFVPDLTGDIDTCIKSIANGINKEYLNKNLLTGTSMNRPINTPQITLNPISPVSTRLLTVGFEESSYANPNPLVGINGTFDFSILLKQPTGDVNNPTSQELESTEFNITIESYTNDYIQEPVITPTTPIYFDGVVDVEGNKQFTLTFGKLLLQSPQQQTIQIVLKVTPLSQNRLIESDKEFFTYTQLVNW